jgi:hypothetical protein
MKRTEGSGGKGREQREMELQGGIRCEKEEKRREEKRLWDGGPQLFYVSLCVQLL